MLELRELRLQAGAFRLGPIHLEVQPGGCLVILGPTGSGKTMLLEAIAGLRPLESGQITLGGRDLDPLPPEARGIGYVPQDLALFPHLTVEENILFGPHVTGRPPVDNLDSLLETTGVLPLLDRRPSSLSGGEKQRVALLRALATGAQYLLLDEPLAALHESLRRDLDDLILALARERNLGIVVVSHDLAQARQLGDQITLLLDGQQRQQADRHGLWRRPADAEVARFLGYRNLWPTTVLDGHTVRVDGLANPLVLAQDCAGLTGTVGIASDEVMALRDDQVRQERPNRVEARVVQVTPRGGLTRILTCTDGGRKIELEMPAYAVAKLAPEEGGSLTLNLKPESLIFFPD